MPNETTQAIEWALKKSDDLGAITKERRHDLVDFVRKYFKDNNIDYVTFSFKDLEPYIN